MDVNTACFLKKYYRNVIKWWLVVYNPEVVRIWPSQQEKEEALRLEALEQEEALRLEALEQEQALLECSDDNISDEYIPDDAYNATTGSYSGLYGQKPVDEETQKALDAIMGATNSQNNIDFLLSDNNNSDITIPPLQDDIINEANAIYERLLQEAADDEAKKRSEVEHILDTVEKNSTME